VSSQQFLLISHDSALYDRVRDRIRRIATSAEVAHFDPTGNAHPTSGEWARFDVFIVCSDLGLDQQDGFDWALSIRQSDPRAIIVMLTPANDKQAPRRAFQCGVKDYVPLDAIATDRFSNAIEIALKAVRAREVTQIVPPADPARAVASAVVQSALERTEILPKSAIPPAEQASGPETSLERTQPLKPPSAASEEATMVVRPDGTVHSPPAPVASSELVIPGYTILRPLGEGGQATVFLASRDSDGTVMTVKVVKIDPDDPQQEENLMRFMREYKIIRKFDHPNIAKVYDRGFEKDFVYVTMEFLAGGDLRQRIKQGIPPKNCIAYLDQIAQGLGAAHQAGIIHRDIKPANIMFRDYEHLAIIDFGIAKDPNAQAQIEANWTMKGSLLGSFSYMSPEQISGADSSVPGDLYSLGIMLYEMLTGEYPFERKNLTMLITAHLKGPIPALPEALSAYQALIDKLLAKTPLSRFQSAAELCQALKPYL
jgi:tRNA A-37 threonylcarbamoyl transferase component Bud32/DNA-binding NarL/FixJ family response regulator